jgi:hypothetical protein
MAVVKNKTTPEGREFWRHVETIAQQVRRRRMITIVTKENGDVPPPKDVLTANQLRYGTLYVRADTVNPQCYYLLVGIQIVGIGINSGLMHIEQGPVPSYKRFIPVERPITVTLQYDPK